MTTKTEPKVLSDDEIRQTIIDIKNEVELTRDSARISLQSTSEARFVEIAFEMLDEDEPMAVDAALIALRNLRHEKPREYLPRIAAFLDIPSNAVSAIWYIWTFGDASYIPRLLPLLNHPLPEARQAALRAISRFDYPDILDIAIYMMNDKDDDVRAAACYILGQHHQQYVVDRLIRTLSDPSWQVQSVAVQALWTIGSRQALEATENWKDRHKRK